MSHVSFIDNFSQIGYITFINYNGSISTDLNKTMQTKQPAMKKKPALIQGTIFVVDGYLAENFHNFQLLFIYMLELYSIYLF